MNKIIATALIAFAVSMCATVPAEAWYCQASGTTGATGWGTAGRMSIASRIALRQCAIRTPRWGRCFIDFCR
jgi:hypothetical protein